MEGVVAAIDAVARELMLFAAAGFLLGGIDDLLVDVVWLAGRVRTRFLPGPRLDDLAQPATPLRFAVFVATWREERVIGPMLRAALRAIDHPDYRIYVATYPNDDATIAAAQEVAQADPRVRVATGARIGPTTKAANLNVVWRALLDDDARAGCRTDAIVIHDAEDVIHADELSLHQAMLADADVVQTPVVPLIHPQGRLVSGVYADEFAESHHKGLTVRSWLGAGLPLAGVGCAIRIGALERLAGDRDGPFDPASNVEDYEMGLKLAEAGCRSRFAWVRGRDGRLIATRAYFPHALAASVRQKARWMAGIALSGWDRIGWSRPLAWSEHWMRARDRRGPLAVLVLAAAYLGLIAWSASWAAHLLAGTFAPAPGRWTQRLFEATSALLVWRMAMRALHTGAVYGWAEAFRSIPRVMVANFVALLAVRLALWRYVAVRRGEPQRWDKTEHEFPDVGAAA